MEMEMERKSKIRREERLRREEHAIFAGRGGIQRLREQSRAEAFSMKSLAKFYFILFIVTANLGESAGTCD